MKKLYILILLLIPLFATAQIDTAHYLQKPVPAVMRTDTVATNLLTYNQTTHQAELMSGLTLKNYFQNNVLFGTSSINILSKSASYTIVSGDISPSKQPIIYLAVDCTSGSNTQTMPSATTYAGYTIKVTKTDATANTITISGVAADNIISVKGTVKEFISLSGNWVNN
jgi:hypothetical protein